MQSVTYACCCILSLLLGFHLYLAPLQMQSVQAALAAALCCAPAELPSKRHQAPALQQQEQQQQQVALLLHVASRSLPLGC
jgi:hypothetical protein